MKFKKADLRMWRYKETGIVLVFWYGQPLLAGYAAKKPNKKFGTAFYVRGTGIKPMSSSKHGWDYWEGFVEPMDEFFR